MGSTKSGSPSYRSTKVEKPQASYAGVGQILATNSGTPGAGVGMPEMPKTQQQQLQPSYFSQAQQEPAQTERPKSMVSEVRKAGSQIFSDALGVNTEGAQQDEGLKAPGVSSSRMAGQIMQEFNDSLSGKLDPTKAAEEEVDPSRYGIGAPSKPAGAQYTAAAASPFG